MVIYRPYLNEVVEHHKEEEYDAKEVGKHGQLNVANHFDFAGQVWKKNIFVKENPANTAKLFRVFMKHSTSPADGPQQ